MEAYYHLQGYLLLELLEDSMAGKDMIEILIWKLSNIFIIHSSLSVGDLPPGEVMQIVWNGIPCFIRRITKEEVK